MSVATRPFAERTPDEVALADERAALGWARLDDVLNRATNALIPLAHRGGRPVVFAENCSEAVAAHTACIAAGMTSVPASFHLTSRELRYILDDSAASMLFVGPETAVRGLEAAAHTGVECVIGWRCASEDRLIAWEDWLSQSSPKEPPTAMAPRPFLHYTSGSTGTPKGVETPPAMFPGGDTIAEHFERLRAANFTPSPALIVSPLSHTGPLTTLRSLGAGVSLVVLGRFDPEATLAAIDRYRVASTVMVPTHFARLLGLPDGVRARYDISSLQLVFHTGAACPINVKKQMIDWWGPVFVEAYGATEAGTTNIITSPEWLEHPGSVGRTIPPFEAVVVGEDGVPVGPGEVGVLYFRDTTGRGIAYHNDPQKTAAAHRAPGEFTLGEMGYVDEDGYVYITDRVSDMVVSGGVNIYPAEAENVLMAHPAVVDVACVGIPNEEMGEELMALVVTADDVANPSPTELIDFCRQRLAGYKCPKRVTFVDDLGRNPMGKLNKRTLRSPYWPSERTIG